ncbi:hypothetical protein GGTG_12384 [Gaeumannomyces tritici R3-111a-1]|uniref:Uncharacterized protein n=1 Tax=Gaeumannomyces tritici (strain R3-111a-1) TaxID=644352 RepID=J3PFV9_GAET3|nr:hypothetical protein GGTG_12384 [Gaeumannomyces tritici R3-111a-1]EJT70211.1 hypothetical protein GGTG_12384 [Gaeumannomyces tritici R3-111a-1]
MKLFLIIAIITATTMTGQLESPAITRATSLATRDVPSRTPVTHEGGHAEPTANRTLVTVITKVTPAASATTTVVAGPTKAWRKPTLGECFNHQRFCRSDCAVIK